MITTEEQVDTLREAIVMQAVQDLKNAYMCIEEIGKKEDKLRADLSKMNTDSKAAKAKYNKTYTLIRKLETSRKEITLCEMFFRGDWFKKLFTLADGDMIIERCRELATEERRIKRKK